MIKRLLLTTSLSLLIAGSCLAQIITLEPKKIDEEVKKEEPKKILIINKTNTAPVIDGRIDEPLWKDAAKAGNFLINDERRIPAKAQTTVYLTYDNKNLYIGFHCDEPYIDKIKARITEHDGPVWEDDCVEVFIDSNNDEITYYHFMVNSKGVNADEINDLRKEFIKKHDLSWESNLITKSFIGKDFWSTELAIPLKKISPLKRNDIWRINLNRERKVVEENSCWSYLVKRFHQPKRFGYLAFKGEEYTITNVLFPSFAYGDNPIKLKIRNEDNTTRKVKLNVHKKSLLTEIPSGEEKEVTVYFKAEKDGKLSVSLSHPKSNKLYYLFSKEFSIPPLMTVSLRNKLLFAGEEDTLSADINLGISSISLKDTKLRVILEKNKKILTRKKFEKITSPQLILSINTTKMAPGKYTLSVDLLNKKEKILSSHRENFEIIEGY